MSQLNSVWVFSDNPERYAELFGGAQQWGQQVYAIVQNTDQAQAVMPYGPKCIYVLEQNDALQRTENYAESIAALLKDKHPAMLLLAATKRGKALAARLSVQLNAALVNDATAVDIVDGHICAEHRMYGGLAFAREKINSPWRSLPLHPVFRNRAPVIPLISARQKRYLMLLRVMKFSVANAVRKPQAAWT